jgi:predicted PurR-regulated permease PerM
MGTHESIANAGEGQHDIARSVLAVLFIMALIGSSVWILRPFLGAIVWAGTIVVATWPLMIGLQARLWANARSL